MTRYRAWLRGQNDVCDAPRSLLSPHASTPMLCVLYVRCVLNCLPRTVGLLGIGSVYLTRHQDRFWLAVSYRLL